MRFKSDTFLYFVLSLYFWHCTSYMILSQSSNKSNYIIDIWVIQCYWWSLDILNVSLPQELSYSSIIRNIVMTRRVSAVQIRTIIVSVHKQSATMVVWLCRNVDTTYNLLVNLYIKNTHIYMKVNNIMNVNKNRCSVTAWAIKMYRWYFGWWWLN